MGLPPPLEAVGPQQQQQLVWPAGPSNMEDDGQQQDTSSVALLKEVAVLSDQSPGVQATASLHIISPGAAAGDEAQTKPVGRLLALHKTVWSSGVFCVLCAALIFAFAALLVKLTGGRVPVLEITLIRSGISLVVSAALIKGKGITPVMGHKQNIKWLIPRGVFGATAMTTFYAAILLLPLADGMTLFFLNPCLTAVAAWALRGEPLGLLGLAGCLCSLIGMVVLIHPPMIFGGHASWGPRRIWGTGFGLVSAICCAGAFISIRYIGKSEPAIVVALYFHLSTAVLSGFPLAFSWPQAAAPISWFDGLMLVGVAAGSFLGQLFMTRSLQLENASLISSLNFSQVLYSYIFGILFFSEHLTLFGVLGSLLVALGMVCVTMRPKDAPADSTAAAAADPTSSAASRRPSLLDGSERARRLDSFKRLLSRARRDAESDSDLQQQSAEAMPLRADVQLTSSGDRGEGQGQNLNASVQQQLQQQSGLIAEHDHGHVALCGMPVLEPALGQNCQHHQQLLMQQQQQVQEHSDQQQRHSSDQLVLTAIPHSPAEVAESLHSIHHRHPTGPSGSLGLAVEQPMHPSNPQQQGG